MSDSRQPGMRAWFKRHWALIRKVLIGAFVVLILTLLGMAVVKVDWNEVLEAMRKLPNQAIWMAALITVGSYIVYSSYELLGKWYTGHGLAWWRCMMVGFISYAFTMSMGAPVGGVGLRMRLYGKQGLQQGEIMRILGLSLVTNWMGYVLVAGFLFAAGIVQLPEEWKLGMGPFRLIGGLMMAACIAYLGVCAFSSRRSWTLFDHEIELPPIGMALTQIIVAVTNWMLIGLVIYVLLQQQIPYGLVLGVLLISAIAGALAHIPGGLGVIEAVFIILLGAELGRGQILGAMLVYRAIYYVCPLIIAGTWYLGTEVKMRKPARHANCSSK